MLSSDSLSLPGLEIGEELGRGAYSIVYRAVRQGRTYALKVRQEVRPEEVQAELLSFLREAAALACVSHPGLTAIHEVGAVGERPYLIMDYIQGTPLDKVLLHGPFGEERLVDAARQVASVLSEVHRRGIIHRDVKPGNILLDEAGGLKLTDFSLATMADSEQDSRVVVGTFLYSSPEQTGMLNRPVRAPSDLYSLGVVLYEMATGRPPFQAAEAGELIRLHANAAPAPPEGVSPALAAIILKLLAKDPDDRYLSAEALLKDLDRLKALNSGGAPFDLGRDEPGQPGFRTALWGRDSELEELLARWAEAARGRGGLVLVEGEAGSGKSRLVSELLHRVREQRGTVLQGKCSLQDNIPFIALKRALNAYLEGLRRRPDPHREGSVRKALGDFGPLLCRFLPALQLVEPEARPLPPGVPKDQFYQALTEFLLELARHNGPTVLFLDDVQWLDEATRDVLAGLSRKLGRYPLLVVLTARSEDEHLAATERVTHALATPPARVPLAPLGSEALRRLVGELLGGRVDDQVADQIARRSHGRPFAAGEYVRVMLDSGLLRPYWGEWRFDAQRLQEMSLPEDLVQLVLQRSRELGPDTSPVLQAAALVGGQFPISLLAEVTGRPVAEVERALSELERVNLVEATRPGRFRFMHDQVRDAFLSSLEPARRRSLHQSIAEALERQGSERPEQLYALAHHYAAGEPERNPEPAARANRRAGLTALSQFAAQEARQFLLRALSWSSQPDAELEAALGAASVSTGRIAEGLSHYQRAHDLLTDSPSRASIRVPMARAHLMNYDTTQVREQVELGFSELGVVPGQVPSELDAARRLTVLELCELLAEVAYTESQPSLLAEVDALALGIARLLEPCPEQALCFARHALICASLDKPRRAERYSMKSLRLADQLEDPLLQARIHLLRAMTVLRSGAPLEAELLIRHCLQEHGRWLTVAEYLDAVTDLVWNLLIRGYLERALEWVERGLGRAGEGELHGHVLLPFAGSLRAFLGHPHEGLAALQSFRAIAEEDREERYRLSLWLQHRALYLLEQEELAEELDHVLEQHLALGFLPEAAPLHVRSFYVVHAHARLAQARTGQRREERARQLDEALVQLKRSRGGPLLRAHWLAISGQWLAEQGQVDKGVSRIRQASALAREFDAPYVSLEVSTARARILQSLGRNSTASREARIALQIAQEIGWQRRARSLSAEFHLDSVPYLNLGPSLSVRTYGSTTEGVKVQRYLDALLRLSAASTRLLDARDQARAALDESIRVFGAERAFLFLVDEKGHHLELRAGRDAQGQDLTTSTAYSSTLVEQVRATREPLVVAGSDDRAVLGSASAVAHDLRSMMAAPLLHRDQLMGVVYLDNRVARGIFTREDGQILAAMASHIAIALDTARLVRLELHLEAERRQRALADGLREITQGLSSTLDRLEVMRRFIHSVRGLVPFDRALAMMVEGTIGEESERQLVPLTGLGYPELSLRLPVVAGELLSETVLSGKLLELHDTVHEPRFQHPAPQEPLTRSLLAVPLHGYQERVGVLLLERLEVCPFTANEQALLLSAAEQAGIALQNARLYGEVQRLATTDELTGLNNRRQLFTLGELELGRARRYGKPFSAVMIDIDHFKSFNDRFGHSVGDEVLRLVAERSRSALRTLDVIGRYGGEEFCVLLPETGLEAAVLVGERLRQSVGGSPLPSQAGELGVTISLGVAELQTGESLASLLNRADEALYAAKEGGRNRVVSAGRG